MKQTIKQKEEIKMKNGILGKDRHEVIYRIRSGHFELGSTIPISLGSIDSKNSMSHFNPSEDFEDFKKGFEFVETITEDQHWKLRELYSIGNKLEEFLHIQIMGGSHYSHDEKISEILKDELGAVETLKKLVQVINRINEVVGLKERLVVGAKEIKTVCLNTRPTLLSRDPEYYSKKTPEFSLIFLSPYDSKSLADYKKEKKYAISKDLVIGKTIADPEKTKGSFKTV